MQAPERPRARDIETPKPGDRKAPAGCAVIFFGIFGLAGLAGTAAFIREIATAPAFKAAHLLVAAPLVFVGIGVAGMATVLRKRGRSAEALAFEDGARGTAGGDAKPIHLPALKTRPGEVLAERLESPASDWAKAFGLLLISLIWNGGVAALVYHVVESHLRGKPEYFLSVFAIPFVLIGLGLIVGFLRALLVAAGIGRTVVEVSSARLAPGETARFYLRQSGSMRLNRMSVRLVCEEQATYREGTSTSTAKEVVREFRLLEKESFAVGLGQPLELREDLVLPPDAMHSFKSKHNQVDWRIEVKGDVAWWPDFDRHFTIRVEPRALARAGRRRRG